jgi:carbon storage regulator CsrA
MLILSMKENEAVVIGRGANQIRICCVSVQRGRTKIGFEVPREIEVDRECIRHRKDAESAAGK